MVLGSQDRPNGWGREYTRFYGPNVVSYKIVWKVSEVDPWLGVETVKYEVFMVVLVLGLKFLMNHTWHDDEDTLGSSVGSFDVMTYGRRKLWVH